MYDVRKSGHTHREETILFSIFPDFLFSDRRRFWSILGSLGGCAGTVVVGCDVLCELGRHNSLDVTLEATRTPSTPFFMQPLNRTSSFFSSRRATSTSTMVHPAWNLDNGWGGGEGDWTSVEVNLDF